MITVIRKGYRMAIEGVTHEVVGSRSLRGVYFYILRNVATGAKSSIRRDVALKAQQTGQVVVTQ